MQDLLRSRRINYCRLKLFPVVLHVSLSLFAYGVTELALAQSLEPLQAQSNTGQTSQNEMQLPKKEAIFARFRLEIKQKELADLLQEHIAVLSGGADPQIPTPGFLRKLQADIAAILATEGFFSPQIQFQKSEDEERLTIQVDAGTRTTIKDVQITLTGALNEAANAGVAEAVARRTRLLKEWGLPQAAPFRQDDWSRSKTVLLEDLRGQLYAGATLVDSRANIDTESHTAQLEVDIDSGAAFFLGDLQVTGLERYPLWLIDRFNPPKKGSAYSSAKLLDFQRALQNSAYFSSVAFNVDPDSTKADALPIEVSLVERQTRDVGFGTGYSSNTGFRAEMSYRDRNVFNRLWDMRSALRLEQKLQLAYAEIYLPPVDNNRLDSFGVLFDRTNVEGVLTTRSSFGALRTTTNGLLEQRLGLNYTQQKRSVSAQIDSIPETTKSRALVGSIGWTWRNIDDVFAPRKGQRVQLDLALSDKALISDRRFVRLYGKYQYWLPVGERDSILFRTELGKVFSQGVDGIPENYLFRTGGSSSVRGYAYQSLGIREGKAVLGGQVIAASSLEYVHWKTENLGIAAFVDTGDAAANWRDFSAKQGIGLGARVRTPAGPIAVDLAYGRQVKKLRLDISIAIAF